MNPLAIGLSIVAATAVGIVILRMIQASRRATMEGDARIAAAIARIDRTGEAMKSMVLRAFPEGDTSHFITLLTRLGFEFGKHSGFVPHARPSDIEELVHAMYPPQEVPIALSQLRLLGDFNSDAGRGQVHLAVLRLAQCDLLRLKKQVQRAKIDFRDVLVDAETLNAFNGIDADLEPKAREQADQVFREYVLWLAKYLLPSSSNP